MPSWLGGWEIAIVLVLALVIFGPKKLPELGSSLGKSIRGFRKGLKDSQDEVKSTLDEVKEASGVADIKASVTEMREAVDLKGVKDDLSLKPDATAATATTAATAATAATDTTSTTSTEN
jgi:sec-independent protein translocase protein TatA